LLNPTALEYTIIKVYHCNDYIFKVVFNVLLSNIHEIDYNVNCTSRQTAKDLLIYFASFLSFRLTIEYNINVTNILY